MTDGHAVLQNNWDWKTALLKILYRVALVLGALLSLGVFTALIAYLDVSYRHRDRIRTFDQIEHRPVALVLGAGIYPSGRLSAVLSDRMHTAMELYDAGKVDKLLLSGDNRFVDYNEPASMGEFARNNGVPESALAYDYAGRRTFDSCYRAKHIFGQDQVVLVTQIFHLPRALYICEQLGIDAIGIVADRRPYRMSGWFKLRESLARVQAWIDIHLRMPDVVGGEAIDIFAPDYNGRLQ